MQDSWFDFFNGVVSFQTFITHLFFDESTKKLVAKMHLFLICSTKLFQLFKSYGQSKIEKGKIRDCAKSLDYYHSKSASRGPKDHLHGKWWLKLGQDKPTLKIDCLAIEWHRFFSWWMKYSFFLEDSSYSML